MPAAHHGATPRRAILRSWPSPRSPAAGEPDVLRQVLERTLGSSDVEVAYEFLDGDRVRILSYVRRRRGQRRGERVAHMEGRIVTLQELTGATAAASDTAP